MGREPRNREAVRRMWEAIEARDWDGAREAFHPDVVVDWPHSRERIRGRDDFIDLNRAYPEGWSIRVDRVVADGDVVVSEITVSQDDQVFRTASVFVLDDDGLITRATEYWVTEGYDEVARWRDRWVERYGPGEGGTG
jgi:ketosteroid isomerase-like protein